MRWRDVALSICLAVLCVAAAFPDAVLEGASLVPGATVRDDPAFLGTVPEDLPRRLAWDTSGLRNSLPDELVAARALRRGELPLWNPYVGTGMPLLAQGGPAPLSPFLAPFWASPGERGYTFAMLLRLVLAVAGAALLSRRLGTSRTGAALTGVAYGLSGLSLFTFDMFVMGTAFAMLPVLAAAALGAARDWRRVPLLALATGVTIFATHPELAALAGVGATLLALVHGADRRVLARLAVGFTGGLAVGALAALPFLAFLLHAWSYKKDPAFAGLFRSDMYLFVLAPETLWLGAVPLGLAALALRPGPLRRFAAVTVGLFALLLAAQTVAPTTLGAQVQPRYALLLPLLGVALLAGAGLDLVAAADRRAWLRAAVIAAVAWAALDALTQGSLHEVPLLRATDLLGAALLVAIAFAVRARPAWRQAGAAALVLGWGTLAALAAHTLTAPPGRGLPASEARRALRDLPGPPARLAATGTGAATVLLPNVAALLGKNDARAVSALYPERYRRYWGQIAPAENLATSSLLARVDDPLVDRAGVSHALATADAVPAGWRILWHDEHVALLANPGAAPRVFIPADVTPVADEAAAAELIRTAHCAEGIDHAIQGARGSARIATYADTRVEIDVAAETPALVVLSDTFDADWTAEVDGRGSRIYPTDLLFRGVLVEAGAHRITLRYRPAAARWGLAISAAATLLCLALLIIAKPRLLV